MKTTRRIILPLIILSFFLSSRGLGQAYTFLNSYGYEWKRGIFDTSIAIPTGDTVTRSINMRAGFMVYKTSNATVYVYNGSSWQSFRNVATDTLLYSTKAYRQKGVDSINTYVGALSAYSISTNDKTNWTEAYNKYSVSGTYSAGTITFTRKDLTTWTVIGLNVGTITSVSGTSTRISSTGGSTPVIDLVTINATPSVYGSATAIPTITVDAYGRATTIGTVSPQVTNTSTNILTNKRISMMEVTAASYTTSVTINADITDFLTITAQAGALLFNAPTGTLVNGQMLLIRIKDDGTARALTYNSIFRQGTTVGLPATTTISKVMYMEFLYNTTAIKWDLVGYLDGL